MAFSFYFSTPSIPSEHAGPRKRHLVLWSEIFIWCHRVDVQLITTFSAKPSLPL